MGDRAYNLAIETSSRIGSITLARGDAIVDTVALDQRRRHNVELMPAIDRLLKAQQAGPRDLGEVYLSIGPGSFTGLRVAVATAKMLAEALSVRLIAVPTLEVVAQNAPPETAEHLAVCLALKQNTLYTALFGRDADRWAAQIEPRLLTIDQLLEQTPRPLAVLGDPLPAFDAPAGVSVLAAELAVPRSEALWRLGRLTAARGEYADPQRLVPLYVRPPEAEELWARRTTAANSPASA